MIQILPFYDTRKTVSESVNQLFIENVSDNGMIHPCHGAMYWRGKISYIKGLKTKDPKLNTIFGAVVTRIHRSAHSCNS